MTTLARMQPVRIILQMAAFSQNVKSYRSSTPNVVRSNLNYYTLNMFMLIVHIHYFW